MNKEPIRHSTPATIEPSVWRAGVKLPRYPFRYATSFSMLGQTMACLIAVGVLCLGMSFVPTLSFVNAMVLALIGTALILLPLGDRANTRIAPLSIYAQNPHATQRVPCVVILTVDGFELWRDMGVVGFEDVRLVYAGLRTSFALRPENLYGLDPPDSARVIRLRLPGESRVLIEFRPFERFIEGDRENRRRMGHQVIKTAQENSASRPVVSGPTRWPPLDLLVRNFGQVTLSGRWWVASACGALILVIVFLALLEKPGGVLIVCLAIASIIYSSNSQVRLFEAYLKARDEADDPASLPVKV